MTRRRPLPARVVLATAEAFFHVLGRLRRARPIHTRGLVVHGTLTVHGGGAALGVPLLGRPGRHLLLARLSRAAGLSAPLPDVVGLAFRVMEGDRPADVLLSTTGTRRVGRRVLVPRRHVDRPVGSLLAFRTPTGPVLLLAVPAARRDVRADGRSIATALRNAPLRYRLLAAAPPAAPWRKVARLDLERPAGPGEAEARFDPVLNGPRGLEVPTPWAALRAVTYAAGRAAAGDGGRTLHG